MSAVAYEMPNFYVGVVQANLDMSLESSYQFVAVDVIPASGLGLSGAAIALPASGGAILGVQQNNPLLGEASTVMVHGISKARLSGTVAEGDLLKVDAAGKFLVATSGMQASAKAMQAGVSGDVIAVLLKSYGKV